MTPAKFHFRSLALLVTLVLTAAGATAAPYVPRSDDHVLERLPLAPTDPTARELRGLRQALAQQPGRLDLAIQLARRYTEIGRVTGDPRFAGYAQAALAGWWEQTEPPADVLLIRATLRQRTHDFDAALADLAVLLQRHPRDGQARLTRATILQVQGAFDAAASECAALRRLAPEVVWAACAYGLASVTGHLRASYDALNSLLARQAEAKPEVQAWVLSMLAEMATRAGLNDAAEAHFRAALAIDPSDHYLLTAYADWLLDQRRASEVVQLLASQQRTDALLLRHALALKALNSPASRGRQSSSCAHASPPAACVATVCICARRRASPASCSAISVTALASGPRQLGRCRRKWPTCDCSSRAARGDATTRRPWTSVRQWLARARERKTS
jgi:tetratricopeptide (TPR) repeat protein